MSGLGRRRRRVNRFMLKMEELRNSGSYHGRGLISQNTWVLNCNVLSHLYIGFSSGHHTSDIRFSGNTWASRGSWKPFRSLAVETCGQTTPLS